MLKKKYLIKLLSLILIAQIIVGNVFAVSYMKIGRTSSDLTVNNLSTFLQKAYCTNGNNYYLNADADSSTVMRLSTVLRYISGDTTISTGNFTYTSFAGWTIKSNTPRLVTNADAGYESLESGYPYIKMENSTSASQYYLGTGLINFGNFYFINNFGITGTNLKFNYNTSNPTIDASTIVGIEGGSNTLPNPYNYLVDVKFIPEPCTVDSSAPQGSNYSLSGVIVQRAAIDSGVNFRITEPAGVAESYAYVTGDAKQNNIDDPLNTGYIATGTYNQWGINTGSIRITLTYTGVARGTMDQRGTGIAIAKVFSGSDLDFVYLTGPGDVPVRTWNMNYLGAYVSVKSTVLDAMPEFRKETQASIVYSGYDRANALPNIVNISGTARNGANLFSQSFATFNQGTSNIPTSFLSKDAGGTNISSVVSTNTRVGVAAQQISGSHSQFHFAFTDNRAGIASGSIKITVQVFTATNTLQSNYQTNLTTPTWSYVFSGSDLNLFASGGVADYPDYTGYIDLIGKRTLITGDRVVINVYTEDFVGNSKSQTGSFDMQDYPPAPTCNSMTIQLENHLALTDDKVVTSPPSLVLSGYCEAYGAFSGFVYNGLSIAELTGENAGSNLTGAFLEDNVITGYAHVDTGLSTTKTFSFDIIIWNIYNQTGSLSLNINVEPSCADAEGCGPKIMMYTGMSLYDAEINYPLTGTWYNNWFVKIKGGDRPVLTGDAAYAILYCGGSGGITTIDISNLDGHDNTPYDALYTFSGSTLYTSGDNVYGMSGIIYLTGDAYNVIYVFRDLTGSIAYDTGKYVSGTTQINWTRSDIITGGFVISGGYITGDTNSIMLSSGIEIGGGRRWYTYSTAINTGFDILIENRWNTSGTVDPMFYQTGMLRFNNSWIDKTAPVITTGVACQSPHTGTITLTSALTGWGEMFLGNTGFNEEEFTGNLTYTTGDDDLFIITAITTGTDFTTYGDNAASGYWLYDFAPNSGYSITTGTRIMSGEIFFIGNRSGFIHFTDKAGNTGYVFVDTTCIKEASVMAYAIPGYREEGNYAVTGRLDVYTLTGSPAVGTLYSGHEGSFGSGGTGMFTLGRPLYGQTIGVVLHTTMHLPALGFTGVFTETGLNNEDVGTGLVFDFTAWTGLEAQMYSSGWFDAVDLSSLGLGVRSLLVPGDVYKTDNDGGTGSIINAFDMQVINQNLTLGAGIVSGAIDFDRKDGIISSFEQAIIIQNLQREGRDLDLDQFGGLVYTGF